MQRLQESKKLLSNWVYTIALYYQGVHAKLYDMDYAGEVGVNVLQENDDDVDMPDVAIHDADEEPSVNTEPMAIVNNVFRNS